MNMQSLTRPTYIEVNLDNIKSNVQNEISRLNNGQEVFAVVKANAYGHGIVEVAAADIEAGASGLCVATLDEAVVIRKSGIKHPILVLGVTTPDDENVKLAEKYDISLSVATVDWLKEVSGKIKKIKIHLAIDTGMNRIGFTNKEDVLAATDYLKTHDEFVSEGIFTHFATADSMEKEDVDYFKNQLKKFEELIKEIDIDFRYIHVSNSAAALFHEIPDCFNVVRFGAGQYGLNPSGKAITEIPYELKPALTLYSELVFVKKVPKGSKISYGITYEAQEDEWIGTIPIGYADGWNRKMQGFHVIVDGQYCEIVGRVCMDQMMVRLPKEYEFGTKVTLIGTDGDKTINTQDVADHLGTINYEIVCDLSDRITRKYVK